MRRLLLPLLALAALLAVPAASQAYITGIGDQRAEMFTAPLFKPLGLKKVRYIAPYDAASVDFETQEADNYLAAAKTYGADVMVAFGHSRKAGRVARLPSVKEYIKEFKKFHKRYPQVKTFQTWNEANHCSQPTCKNPKRVAEYYIALKKACKGCKIVALDVLDAANIKPTLGYIRKFMKYAKSAKPRIWGLHNYSDTNRFQDKRTKAVLKLVPGEVWLTETGGVVNFGGSFPYDEDRAAKALTYMFKLAALNKRIKRLYIYQWTGAPKGTRFDAGLVGPDGAARPGYDVVKKKLGK
jgi:hypothetical protein